MNNRNQEIDFIRGLMILLVIVGHTLAVFLNKGQIQSGVADWIYTFIYTFHMPVLFSLSGYVCALQKKEHSLGNYVWKLFCSLYIPYLVFQMVYGFERVVGERVFSVALDHPTDLTFHSVIKNFIITENLCWFLLVMCFIRFISFVFHRYSNDYIAVLFFMAMFWLGSLYVESNLNRYLIYGIFYEVGYFMKQIDIDEIQDTKVKIGMCLISVQFIGLGVYRIAEHGRSVYDYYAKWLIGIPMFVILLLVAKYFKRWKPICLCGRYSMVYYLIPGLMQYGVFYVLSKCCTSLVWIMILGTLIQIFVASLVVWAMTRVSWLRWLQMFFYPYRWFQGRRD